MRIGVISDTHGLVRDEARRALAGVDRILHAGDVGGDEVLAALGAVAPVDAVRGNTDHEGGMVALPDERWVELAGRVFFILHDLGRLSLDPRAAGIAVVVHGHTHRASVERAGGGLLLNPGSAGPRRSSAPVTLAILTLGREIDVELVDLLG